MQSYGSFFFYGSLNDFLPKKQRNAWIPYLFAGSPAIKDALEALGVPHPEIGLIKVNKAAVDFRYHLQPGDLAEVFPATKEADSLQPPIIWPARFVVDGHLGKLAKNLRLLGFDTLYQNHFSDEAIAGLAQAENRIVLTRDVGLLKRKTIIWGYWLRSQHLPEQLSEVIGRFDLRSRFAPFTRCLHCNGLITAVTKEAVLERLPPNTRLYFQEFYQCQTCLNVYWKGSHFERMASFIRHLSLPGAQP